MARSRPLSILYLEDKIIQQPVATVLEAIYEEDFFGLSYWVRQGPAQYDALDAPQIHRRLALRLYRRPRLFRPGADYWRKLRLAQSLVKGFLSELLAGAEPRAVRIMSMRARNVAGTCRRPG
jgi:hypothetical protein